MLPGGVDRDDGGLGALGLARRCLRPALLLSHYIPESPRFLARAGLQDQAHAVLARFARGQGVVRDAVSPPMDMSAREAAPLSGQLMRGQHAPITWGLVTCGVAWGLSNFGFLLWLPTNLGRMGMDPGAASVIQTRAAVLALPGTALVILMYHRWSSLKSLVAFIALTTASLVVFFVLALAKVQSGAAMSLATALLLFSGSGVIAMLIPYAAEVYPVHLRGTGAGLVAGASKFGGILGALAGVFGLFNHFAASALFIALPMAAAAVMLMRNGVETRGRGLEDIQQTLQGMRAR
ncbi:MAG: MFS transporter [Ramlibacter sp.]